jgi:hypothetical protein
MFERNPRIKQITELIWTLLVPMKRGDILMHEQLQEIMGVEPHQHPWGLVISNVRRRMELERGITLISELMVGYKLASPDEQLREGPRRVRRAKNQLVRGARSVDVLPAAELSFHQQCRKVTISQELNQTLASMKREERLVSFLLRPHEAEPRGIPEQEGNQT